MDAVSYLKFFLAFAFVLGLMFLLSLAVRRFNLGGAVFAGGGRRRLKLVEFMPLDGRRKLAIIRRDDVEHLLLLGANGETVVETNITPPQDKAELAGKVERLRA